MTRMSFSMRLTALFTAGAILALPAVSDPAPARVVSMNLCTDQLAMLLAAPGQLVSVSDLAANPQSSAMADQAAAYPVNHAEAEEVYLLAPDVVVAGSYTSRASVAMLRRLDVPVEIFKPARKLEDVPELIRQMGGILGREDAAEALVADFEAQLAELRREPDIRPRAALYSAKGYTRGGQTLAGQILAAAGYDNIASDAGFPKGGYMPLEILAMSNPDIVITAHPYPGASRAEEILEHPVVTRVRQGRASAELVNHDWTCGTPYVLAAIEALSEARRNLEIK